MLLTVEIGGKDRKLKFGTNSTARYCKIRGISLFEYTLELVGLANLSKGNGKDDQEELKGIVNIKGDEIRDLIYAAMWAYDMSAGNIPDYTEYTVGDWLDECGEETVRQILEALGDSNNGMIEQKSDKGGSKKK